MGRFRGFADAEGKFFRKLAKNQRRDWFMEHKEEFEAGWNEPMADLLADLREAIDPSFAHCDLGETKVFRIYRDVRFSKDKTPYKTHVAGVIPIVRTSKITETPVAVYMHFGMENVVASGLYVMDGPALARYRAAVAEDTRGKELSKILAKVEKAGFSTEMARDRSLKKVPKGFDPEHPRADLLKRKSLGASYPSLPKGMLASPKLVPWLAQHVKMVVPLVEWLVFATA